MSPTSCTVCSSATTKYKCHLCFERTCSLDCFKSHASLHQDQIPAPSAPQAKPNVTADTDRTQSADPLLDFASSPDLQELLRTNPDLREKLRSIYDGVRDSGAASNSAAAPAARGRRRTPWQRPDHLERGVTEIKTALEGSGVGSEAMRRFVDIITKRSAALPGVVELETPSKP